MGAGQFSGLEGDHELLPIAARRHVPQSAEPQR